MRRRDCGSSKWRRWISSIFPTSPNGSIAGTAGNVLIYATSNRRHMLPEYFAENLETKHIGAEVHPGESVEEKISLSERFGLWVPFYPFAQDDYLAAVDGWLQHFGVKAT